LPRRLSRIELFEKRNGRGRREGDKDEEKMRMGSQKIHF
jgi:hypothetical protein